MKSTRHIVAAGIIGIAVILLAVWYQPVRHIWYGVGAWLRTGLSPQEADELVRLRMENEQLRFALQESTYEPINDTVLQEAQVYARYPFNNRETFIINRGSDDGMMIDMPVLTTGKLLIGKIIRVTRTQSEVQTIFDPTWKSSVAIGDNRAQAVLTGGQVPSLDLISKDEVIVKGDAVFNLDPLFPFYQPIGSLETVRTSADEVWYTGSINVPYSIEDIVAVFVHTDFP